MSRERSDETGCTTSDWTRKGIRYLYDDSCVENVKSLQSSFDIPEKAAILSDLGHHLEPDQVVREANSSIRAGACSVHLHVKGDFADQTSSNQDLSEVEVFSEIISKIRENNEDVVIDTGPRGKTYEDKLSYLRKDLVDVVTLGSSKDPEYLEPLLEIVETQDAVPRMAVFDTSDVLRVKSHLIDRGLFETPALWAVALGNPYKGVPTPSPEKLIRRLLMMLECIREIDSDPTILEQAPGSHRVISRCSACC